MPPALPIFDGDQINLLMVRWCQPVFSAALIAYVESHVTDPAEQNALCRLVPSPEHPVDWLRMWAVTLANMASWRQNAGLNAWLSQCRLNSQNAIMRGMRPDDTAKLALLQESGAKAAAAAARLPALLATAKLNLMEQTLHELRLETLQVGALRMRVASQGSGPLVLLCHGFPESWYSWRHQLAALAAAGFRAVAPDMRGYGGTDAPPDAESYTMLHLVGDMVELVNVLGESEAVIVGHDWGAPVAWNAAMLRPDLFRAVVGMSVPFHPPAREDLLSALERQGIRTFYMQYFQTPGVAESEFEADPEAAIRRITFSMSGDGPGARRGGNTGARRRFSRQHGGSRDAARLADQRRDRLCGGRVRAHGL